MKKLFIFALAAMLMTFSSFVKAADLTPAQVSIMINSGQFAAAEKYLLQDSNFGPDDQAVRHAYLMKVYQAENNAEKTAAENTAYNKYAIEQKARSDAARMHIIYTFFFILIAVIVFGYYYQVYVTKRNKKIKIEKLTKKGKDFLNVIIKMKQELETMESEVKLSEYHDKDGILEDISDLTFNAAEAIQMLTSGEFEDVDFDGLEDFITNIKHYNESLGAHMHVIKSATANTAQ
jgi:hypothetical protein